MTRPRSNAATLFLLLVLALVLIGLDRASQISGPQDLAQRGLGPVERLLASAGQTVAEWSATARDFATLRAENERLRQELEQLRLVNVEREEVAQENRTLRELLSFKRDNPNYTLLVAQIVAREQPARVLGQDPNNLIKGLRIDQGRRDGVAVGMPVVTARGLVGRVVDVGEDWAKVLLVIDEASAVTSLVQQSRATGVVEGMGDGLMLRYIPHGQSVEPGDIVLSSGLGGEVPKGLVVGTVETVVRQDVNPYQEALVRSPIDFSQLEYLFVIKSWRAGDEGAPR